MAEEMECGIDDEAIEKALEKEDLQALLNMVSQNIENRNLKDALILAETSEISTITTTQRLDLLGQAIFTAYYYRAYFEEYELLLKHSFNLAYEKLLKDLERNHINPGIIEEPVGAIVRLYHNPDDLYTSQKNEALRLSQIYFYYSLLNMVDGPEKIQDDLKSYYLTLGMLAVGYANAAGNFFECISMADIIVEWLGKIDIGSLSPDIWPDMRKALYHMTISAIKASRELGRDSEALEWARITEVLSLKVEETGDMKIFLKEKGDMFMALGEAEKALKYYEDASNLSNLNNDEHKNTLRSLDLAKFLISGGLENLFSLELGNILRKNELADLIHFIDSMVSGNANQEIFKNSIGNWNKVINWGSETNTIEPSFPNEGAGTEYLFKIIQAISAFSCGDANSLSTYLPGIIKLSGSDSINQLLASFFLIQLQQGTGVLISWETISPLVLKLLEIESSLYLVTLSILAVILIRMDREELLKAADTVAKLIERINFSDEMKGTPISSFQQTALAMPFIDFLLALLVKIAEYIPAESGQWFERAVRLKYFSSYRILRQFQEAKIFKYSSELPPEDVRQIEKLCELLAGYALLTRGKRRIEENSSAETQLMTLLFPLYSRHRLNYDSAEHKFSFPEFSLAEVPRLPGLKGFESFFLVIVYSNGRWEHYTIENCFDIKKIKQYMERIERHRFLDNSIVTTGMKLKAALLPFPFLEKPISCPLFGVRSTSMSRNICLDALPLVVNEDTGNVMRWVGEEIVSVLLTGRNQNMECLYKPISVNSFSLFANTSFNDLFFHPLPGVQQEVEAIESIIKTQGNISLDIYWESQSNRKNFLGICDPKAPEVIHISTHSITDRQNPSNSCLVLSGKDPQGNGILAAVGYHDILLMDLSNCRLVVLSTCSTHEGKNVMGEGIMGLAWAFKVAGAKVVIASRWPVVDQVTSNFWSCFYDRLFRGKPIGEAFREARLSIIAESRWRHPYYWGVFQLIA